MFQYISTIYKRKTNNKKVIDPKRQEEEKEICNKTFEKYKQKGKLQL